MPTSTARTSARCCSRSSTAKCITSCSGGYVYVAQPPLFRVKSKKNVYYVQTEEEMKTQLLELGLKDGRRFEPGDGRDIKGEEMAKLCRTLAAMEEPLIALERRGISLRTHALRQDPVTRQAADLSRVLGTQEHWFTQARRARRLRRSAWKRKPARSRSSVPPPAPPMPTPLAAPPMPPLPGAAAGEEKTNGHAASRRRDCTLSSCTKCARSTRSLADLAQMGFDIQSLIPQERTGTEEPRYVLRRGENTTGLEDLRGLVAAIRAAGEKGLTITRFKGLGEMNAEELRDTTLDPANRTLLQVTMKDAAGADELFRILMGDNVEPRREFIEKHALEVRNLDV